MNHSSFYFPRYLPVPYSFNYLCSTDTALLAFDMTSIGCIGNSNAPTEDNVGVRHKNKEEEKSAQRSNGAYTL